MSDPFSTSSGGLADGGAAHDRPTDPQTTCPVCRVEVDSADAGQSVRCPACGAGYHAECWEYNGGCAIYGCSQAAVVVPLQPAEIPAASWGRDEKPCPACGQSIRAAASRCRHCGATFEAEFEDADTYRTRGELATRTPRLQRTVLIMLVLAILPCSAPLAALWAAIWVPRHREDLRSLPGAYAAMAWIALIAAGAQTLAMLVAAAAYQVFREA